MTPDESEPRLEWLKNTGKSTWPFMWRELKTQLSRGRRRGDGGVYQGEPARVAVDGGMSSPRRTKAIIVRAAFELMGI